MGVSRHTRAARWAGAVLVGLAPLPWLAAGAAATETAGSAPPGVGNNGTLKVHEEGTPSGTESNDPKVCVFNFEGFSFDAGQTGYIVINPQGGNGGPQSYGPFPWGPADNNGFAASDYFNSPSGTSVADGQYKATLYGKMSPNGQLTDSKAKSKVFKVICGGPQPSSSKPSTTKSSSSAPAITTSRPPRPSTTKPRPSSTSPGVIPSSSSVPVTTTSSVPVVIPSSSSGGATTSKPARSSSSPGITVLPSRSTAPAVLPQTGSGFPTGGALGLSLLLVGLGALLILGPGRMVPLDRRRH